MNGYTKLFGSIIHSTIWQEPHHVRLLWVSMLAMADQDGVVSATVPGLAHATRITVPECEEALAKFQQPDPYSRTSDDEGRRVRRIEGGWQLINYIKYRELMSPEDQKEKHRIRQQNYRDRIKARDAGVTTRDSRDVTVTKSDARDYIAEAEAEAIKSNTLSLRSFTKPSLEEVRQYCQERKNQVDPEKWLDYYEANGWYTGKVKMKNWKAAVRYWEKNNYGGKFNGGYQASSSGISKYQQRVINNREAILSGLGISPVPGQCEPSVQHGHAAGASPDMAGRLLKGKA